MKNQFKHILGIALIALSSLTASAQFDLDRLIQGAGEALQNLSASPENLTVEDLVGTWKYSSPAVSFKGDDALATIGGIAASSTIEDKLAPYFKKAGLNKLKLTVNNDSTFTMTMGKIQLQGTVQKDKDNNLVFNFNAHEKISLGKVACMATKSGNKLSLTFNASRLIAIAKKVSSISSNSNFKSISAILERYESLYVGAYMKR